MLGAGQFCTNPGLILGIKSTSLDGFIATLGAEIGKLEPICMLHPNIHSNYEKGKKELSAQATVDMVADYTTVVAPNMAQQRVLTVNGTNFLKNTKLHQEVFGPFSIIVRCSDASEMEAILAKLEGQLTGTVLGNENEINKYKTLVDTLQDKVGRIIFNGVPTGVEVCPSMQHGGPFPAATDSRFTSVGTGSVRRWVRPVSFQNWPSASLPEALQNENPLGIMRVVDGQHTSTKL